MSELENTIEIRTLRVGYGIRVTALYRQGRSAEIREYREKEDTKILSEMAKQVKELLIQDMIKIVVKHCAENKAGGYYLFPEMEENFIICHPLTKYAIVRAARDTRLILPFNEREGD